MSVEILFQILSWAWIATEVLVQVLTRTSRSQGEVKDRGSLLVLLPVIFVSIWAASWYSATRPPNMFGGAHWLRAVALALLAAGLGIRWAAIYTLGRSFSANVAIHATQTVNKTGLFRWMRHPSYTGMLLIFAGLGFRTANWGSFAILLIFPSMALLYRIQVEERALTEAFGTDYIEYSKVTKRLLPGIY